MTNSNPSPTSIIPVGQVRMREAFIGDGQRDTFDLCEVPSSILDMTAHVSRPLRPIALLIGNLRLDTFAGGYDALVDGTGKRIYLKQALSRGELLLVEYPFNNSNQSPALSVDPNAQAEPTNIPGWEPWDYQNWRDFVAAMHEDKPIEYAMCIWLMQQESNDLAFQDGVWSVWYHYARKHCPRFDRERPRWR
jgi:hypothetical protein